jgi:hypothetical protein
MHLSDTSRQTLPRVRITVGAREDILMNKVNVESGATPGLQTSLPGFPVVEEDTGGSARRRSLIDRARAQSACAPMGTLESIVVSRDSLNERRVWYVVDPDPQMATHYASHGIALLAGCKVLVEAEALRPVALLEIDPADSKDDGELSTPCGFNPYWDLPPV